MDLDATEASNCSSGDKDSGGMKISSGTNLEGQKSEEKSNDNAASELESISSNEDDPVLEQENNDSHVDAGVDASIENASTNMAHSPKANENVDGITEITNNTADEPMDTTETETNQEAAESSAVPAEDVPASETVPVQDESAESEIHTNGDANEQVNVSEQERSETQVESVTSPKPSSTTEDCETKGDEEISNNEKPNDDDASNEQTNDIEMASNDHPEEDEEDQSTNIDPLDMDKSNIDPQEEENSNSTTEITEDETADQQPEAIETPEETNDVEMEEAPVVDLIDEIAVEICNNETSRNCFVCIKDTIAKYSFNKKLEEKTEYICTDKCFDRLKEHCNQVDTPNYFKKLVQLQPEYGQQAKPKFIRTCKQCSRLIKIKQGVCSWEAMDFCMEHCLYRYQLKFTKKCSECTKPVQYSQLGKYSVRFGSILRQFCSGKCLDVRKKKIRICSYCQMSMLNTDISLGMKFFCSETCKGKYVNLMTPNKPPYIPPNINPSCHICDEKKPLTIEFEHRNTSYYFCEIECFITFKFLQNLNAKVNKCHNCWKYAMQTDMEEHGMYYEGVLHYFCSLTCKHIHIITHRRIIPCIWCKVKKYNFDMIHRDGLMSETVYTCSLLCLNHVCAAINHITAKGKTCEQCGEESAVCDISTIEGKTKSFCSNKCIAEYQSKSRKREIRDDKAGGQLPVITSVCSLAQNAKPNTKEIIVFQDALPPEVANKMTSVRPMSKEQGTSMDQTKCDSEAQTDLKDIIKLRALPVPIYIPQPLNMWQCPLPRAVPFPLVVPIPLLVPLTRDSSTDYLKSMKYLKQDTVKAPSDPFEAELLMMAELVAAEKPKEDDPDEAENNTEDFSPEPADGVFNDDMLQIALKMATDYHEPPVDLEGALTANTITPGHHQSMELTNSEDIIHTEPLTGAIRGGPGRGRGRGRGRGQSRGSSSRRGRGRPPAMPVQPIPEPTPPPPPEPVEKPDAHMCLKFTFGVNAWKQWVTTKNADLERSSRKLKLFNTDLLQMTADELNYSLCLFVNEVRKPNGTEYAPDTIYYLCLGIQQYLYESGRIDNIFCDSYYEKFTDCLDDVCSKFSTLYNDAHYIVTRVEEEHLWESKQLGAHSPFVLLTTLMFFNTKHFNLTSVEEHMQLSFSHIMKHWKRNPNAVGVSRQSPAAGRNVLLRFYPPQNTQANSRKKKVYEQQENEDNPLRCPVKLYEFYLSKCPESVKTRNDVFYLLPERSCVPESPVWYSTMALDLKALKKMLHRVKMVKEINVALLTH